MNCPNCNVTLLISTRQEIEIDYCPQCRGIWLDRGELDKIIERSAQVNSKWYRELNDDDDHHKDNHQAHKKHKKSFLGEFFAQLNLSAPAYHRILKTARPIAALVGCEDI